MGVQVCRLPALKPLKPSKRSKRSKPLKPSKPFKTVKPLKRWLGMLHPAANRHPKATHQWLLMGIQVCRLPALLQPTGTPGPYINGFSPRPHINGFFWASKSAVCQPSCSQQAPQGHTSMASYGRPSLPFASPQTLKTLQTLQTLQTLKTLQTLQNRKTLKTLTWHASSFCRLPPSRRCCRRRGGKGELHGPRWLWELRVASTSWPINLHYILFGILWTLPRLSSCSHIFLLTSWSLPKVECADRCGKIAAMVSRLRKKRILIATSYFSFLSMSGQTV